MSLKNQIVDDFKKAFKEKDAEKKSVLSLLQAEIKNKEIELKKREDGLSDEEVVAIVQKAIKQRKDSVEQFKAAGREEMAADELKEIEILQAYLPEQISDEEVEKEVKAVIEQTGATSKADIGKVMGMAMARLKGKTDGNKVREIAEKILV